MRNSLYLLFLILLISLNGCATSGDLKALRSELNRSTEEKITAVDADVAALRNEIGKSKEALAQARKGTANTAADITDLRDNVQQLRGQVEGLRKDLARSGKKEEEYKEKFDNIYLKINFITPTPAILELSWRIPPEMPDGGDCLS